MTKRTRVIATGAVKRFRTLRTNSHAQNSTQGATTEGAQPSSPKPKPPPIQIPTSLNLLSSQHLRKPRVSHPIVEELVPLESFQDVSFTPKPTKRFSPRFGSPESTPPVSPRLPVEKSYKPSHDRERLPDNIRWESREANGGYGCSTSGELRVYDPHPQRIS